MVHRQNHTSLLRHTKPRGIFHVTWCELCCNIKFGSVRVTNAEIAKKIQETEAEVVGACDEKRGALHRKDGDGNESTREKEERKA